MPLVGHAESFLSLRLKVFRLSVHNRADTPQHSCLGVELGSRADGSCALLPFILLSLHYLISKVIGRRKVKLRSTAGKSADATIMLRSAARSNSL